MLILSTLPLGEQARAPPIPAGLRWSSVLSQFSFRNLYSTTNTVYLVVEQLSSSANTNEPEQTESPKDSLRSVVQLKACTESQRNDMSRRQKLSSLDHRVLVKVKR